jgi:hypothetical protein
MKASLQDGLKSGPAQLIGKSEVPVIPSRAYLKLIRITYLSGAPAFGSHLFDELLFRSCINVFL